MIKQILTFNSDNINYLCTVCVSDNNGAKTAVTIIVLSLIFLGLANWAWKKYFASKKQISQQK